MKSRKQYNILPLLIIFLLLCPLTKIGAFDYNIESIPDSLKDGAVAVLRDYSATYTQHDVNNGTFTVSYAMTILNEKGNSFAQSLARKDKFVDLQKFEGILKSNTGKEIKKIKRKDLIESSFSDQMATGDTKLFYIVSSPVYPYTIEYTYEIKFKNGIINYYPFNPIMGTGQSVEKAEYRIEVPLETKLRFYSNFDCEKHDETTEKQKIYTFRTGAMKAIKNEPLSPSFSEYAPIVRIGVTDFCYDKSCGDYSTWESWGVWQNGLLNGRDILPPDAVAKIGEITKDAKTDREKVAIIYKFLQDNSRYVSIQLGIGGFQPFSAESTYKNRFGDCKALSNLMLAMLKAIDIPSNYTEIYSGNRKSLREDFPDPTQTNHAILRVPLPNDTIWVECTSSTLPLGYIHDGIAGHDALVVTEEGGLFCQLPNYSSKENLAESFVEMNIALDGKIEGKMKFVEHVHGYGDWQQEMRNNDRKTHIKYITNRINFSSPRVGEIKTSEDVSDLPSCTLEADYVAEDAINISGQRMFIPLLPLKKGYYSTFTAKNRTLPIDFGNAFSESDSIIINIPTGYTIESLPKAKETLSPYGTLRTKAEKVDDNTIVYTQYVELASDRYDQTEYDTLKAFFKEIASASKAQMVIKKNE